VVLGSEQRNRLREISQPLTSGGDSRYDEAGSVIETHEQAGYFKECLRHAGKTKSIAFANSLRTTAQ
jgi:hypothetical protein